MCYNVKIRGKVLSVYILHTQDRAHHLIIKIMILEKVLIHIGQTKGKRVYTILLLMHLVYSLLAGVDQSETHITHSCVSSLTHLKLVPHIHIRCDHVDK